MKKLLVTILAFIYLAVSSGMVLNLHYCMGELKSWDLRSANKNTCGICGMHKANGKGCCHDEQRQLKLDNAQQLVSLDVQLPSISEITLPGYFDALLSLQVLPASVLTLTVHAPPGLHHVPIFVRNRNFRI